ncbi:MAG: hypothetical protein LBG95_06075 [Treponema sp.]|jgi:hypothetical protein|nr:hypothetical protein [Treponema sp.]
MTEGFYSEFNNDMVEAVKNNTAFFMRQGKPPVPGIDDAVRNGYYIPFQSHDAKMGDFNSFLQEQCANAINASFANCAFKSDIPERELGQFKTMLISEIAKNPAFMAGITNKAYQEVMDTHYQPFDRKGFIEKARDENSPEFRQLNYAIFGHVDDMYANKRPSFNPGFNEIAKPLVINIEGLYLNNPQPRPAVDSAIAEFVKEQMKQDRTAGILTDTYAGSFIEKARKVAKVGKIVIAGAAIAGALYTANFPAAAGIAGALASDIMTRHKVPEHYPDTNKVVINNREFKGSELEKILNFDKAPFSLTGGGKIGKRDYEIAHNAERTILGVNPKINKDEYQQDIARRHIIDFYKNTASRMNGGSQENFVKVADNVMGLQELKGNHTLKSCRDDPRSFYACLNQTIRDNPQILDQAVAQVNINKNHERVARRTNYNS